MKNFVYGIALLVVALSIGLVFVNYDKNLDLERQNQKLTSQLWELRQNYYNFYNETKYQDMLDKFYYDSTIVSFMYYDTEFAKTLSEELSSLERSIENLQEKYIALHNAMFTLLKKVSSKTSADINELKAKMRENEQAINELNKKRTELRKILDMHFSKKTGIFKKPHDEAAKNQLAP